MRYLGIVPSSERMFLYQVQQYIRELQITLESCVDIFASQYRYAPFQEPF
jgi:hypothetical protein